MEGQYSTRSPAVKRLMREAQELCEPTDQYFAQPLEDNLFEWHFTIRGPVDSDFQAGIYHGRIILPVDYPMKPPSIIWLTPNGRFETNKKICLSISGHHPESWQPSWSIRTALLAIIGFMPTHPNGAIGSLDYKPEERKVLAKKSRDWKCPVCGDVTEILLEPDPESSQTSQEAKELAAQISFQGEKPKFTDPNAIPETAVTTATSTPGTGPCTDGASNNASAQPQPSASPQPSAPPMNGPPPTAQAAVNTFHPWLCQPGVPNNNVMPPQFMFNTWATPVSCNREQASCLAAQIPRFPYPPSFYANSYNPNFYPPGFVYPPGLGMFPFHIPPLPQSTFACNPPNAGSPVSNSSRQTSNSSLSHSHIPSTPNSQQQPPAASSMSMPSTGNNLPSSSSSLTVNQIQTRNDKQEHSQSFATDKESLHSHSQSTEITNKETTEQAHSQIANNTNKDTVIHQQSQIDKVVTNALDDDESIFLSSKKSSKHEEPGATIGENCNTEFEPVSSFNVEATSFTDKSNMPPGDILRLMKDIDADQKPLTHFQQNATKEMNLETISQALNKAFDPAPVVEDILDDSADLPVPQFVNSAHNIEKEEDYHADKSQFDDTDGFSVRKESVNDTTGVEISHSQLSIDENDSKIFANQVSELDQRSHFERSTSSMPDLQMSQKHETIKGLRHRQSAIAQVPTNSTGDQSASEPNYSGAARQRIEAVSGDSVIQNQHPFGQAGAANANEVGQNEAQRHQQGQVQSGYDTSFFVMVGLCVTTVFILLNRLSNVVYFSDFF